MKLIGVNYYRKVFEKARELLATPECWVQEEYAMNDKCEKVWPTSPDATAFCAQGALIKADQLLYQDHDEGDEFDAVAAEKVIFEIISKQGKEFNSIPKWNDSVYTNHAKVLKVFDAAIEACGKESHED